MTDSFPQHLEPMEDDLGFGAADTVVLRDALGPAPFGVALVDRNLRYRWMNARFAVISGLPIEAHLGHTPVELWGPPAEPSERFMRDALAANETQVVPFVSTDPAGRQRVFTLTHHPLLGPDGAPVGLCALALEETGRTELLHAQAELRQASSADRARLQAVFTHAPVGVAVVDPGGHVVLHSRAMAELFGQPSIDDDGHATFELRTPDGPRRVVDELPVARTLAEGATVLGESVEVESPSGRRMSLLVSAAPVRQRSGHMQFAVLCCTDVTELREARDQLGESQRNLEAALVRLRRVHELTAQLAGTTSVTDVEATLSSYVQDDLGAVLARLGLLDPQLEAVVLRTSDGDIAPGAPAPRPGTRRWLTEPAASGQVRFHGGHRELLAAYPELSGAIEASDTRVWLSLPLWSGRTVGVCLVAWEHELALPPEAQDDLELVAIQAAVALDRILLDEQQHKVVETLQVALLPPTLPHVAGMTLLARYRPSGHAAAVGGDWFDTFSTPNGLVLSVGDVAGHGMVSAAAMAQLRSAARAYAAEGHGPGEVLQLLDGLLADSEEDLLTSAVVAVFDPLTETLTWARAGHPPPLMLVDGRVDLLDEATGRVLGTGRSTYQACQRPFPVGASLLLYTDGLVERRDATVTAGIAELRSRLEIDRPSSPGALDRLIDGMVAHSRHNDDDICVLLARRGAAG